MPTSEKQQRGFAVMTEKMQRKIATAGGKASAATAKRGKNGRFAARGKTRR
jgi:hypothetical protein